MASVGICSWSLTPSSPEELVERVRACGLGTEAAVQLHLDRLREPGWDEAHTVHTLSAARIAIVSGMISMRGEDYSTLESIRRTGGVRTDVLWGENFRGAETSAAAAGRMGLSLVTFHAGYFPPVESGLDHRTMVDRVRQLAQLFASRGVRLALETGQESPETLLGVLAELNAALPRRWHVGVNFDPANMILYGMGDPVAAVRTLKNCIRQVHIKDALPAREFGEWGTEVVVGTGAVAWRDFFEALGGADVDLMIEREAGDCRIDDIRTAAAYLEVVRGAKS